MAARRKRGNIGGNSLGQTSNFQKGGVMAAKTIPIKTTVLTLKPLNYNTTR